MLTSKKTRPEETFYQLGTLENHTSPKELFLVVTEFAEEFHNRFGKHIHILDWALRLDEGTPHIHERHVFDCENKYGEVAPQQEKALETLGFELPKPDKPLGRYNNRKITFDAACRTLLFDIVKRHGLELEEEPEYGGRVYLEKQDYIMAKQYKAQQATPVLIFWSTPMHTSCRIPVKSWVKSSRKASTSREQHLCRLPRLKQNRPSPYRHCWNF